MGMIIHLLAEEEEGVSMIQKLAGDLCDGAIAYGGEVDQECEATGPCGLCCNRESGHDMPHVAFVEDEPVAAWVDVNASYRLKED